MTPVLMKFWVEPLSRRGEELVTMDVDVEVHGLLGADAGEGVEGDNRGDGLLFPQSRLNSHVSHPVIHGVVQ
jgi:hypothetical protein